VPESGFSRRNGNGATVQSSANGIGGRTPRGELRLQVLCSLPPMHQRYLFEEVRKLCRCYLGTRQNGASEVTTGELLSEVWQKLVSTVSVSDDEYTEPSLPSSTDPAPERDARIMWLLREIGGAAALRHRYEDILRQRHGRMLPGQGRRTVQPRDEDDLPEIDSGSDAGDPLERADASTILRGLLLTAELQFPPHDDVWMLLRVLEDDPAVLEDAPGNQWPIATMVGLLNGRFAPPPWSGDRVENAKRRLVNWVNRLKRRNGYDAVDLEGLFARVARQAETGGTGERVSQAELAYPNIVN
jgi:hypothetical protein